MEIRKKNPFCFSELAEAIKYHQLIKADFQNVSIQSLYAVQLRYINCVDMQSYQAMHQL